MKLKRELTYVQMGLAGASILVWFLLPVFSFMVVMLPVFNISGWSLAMIVNQLMLIPIAGMILMLLGAVLNNRRLMITAGVLEAVIVILAFIFRKDILLGGNFRWIYLSATELVKKVPELVGGVDTSSWDVQQIVTFVVENLLQPGLGGIIHLACTIAYVIIAICAPNAKNDDEDDEEDEDDDPEMDDSSDSQSGASGKKYADLI